MSDKKSQLPSEVKDWLDGFFSDEKPTEPIENEPSSFDLFAFMEDQNNLSLDEKILRDFHGHQVEFDETYTDVLPSLSKKAEIYISSQLEKDNEYFRIQILGGGCSGFQYEFKITDDPLLEDDKRISQNPPAYVDSTSLTYMPGALIDWDDADFGGQLVINNPGAKQSCGCGSSFSFDFDAYEPV